MRGFTLIEIAISMLVITLLATVLLTPITTQVTQSRLSQAKADLDQINEALIGFALAQPKPYLPCPDTNNDGISDACPNTNSTETTGGNIPWVTLNVPANDPWGQRYQYRVNNGFTNSAAGFTLTTAPSGVCTAPGVAAGNIKVCSSATAATCNANVIANGVPAIVYSYGPNGQTAPTSAEELENQDGDCLYVSKTYTTAVGAEFDDVLVWMSPAVLMSRMVTAQKLP